MSDASLIFNGGPGPQRQPVNSPGYAPSKVFNTQPCVFKSVTVTNKSGSDRFLMIFDAASLPNNGAVPDYPPVYIPTKATGEYDGPEATRVGLTAALSSTEDTLTVATANDGFFRAVMT